MHYRHAEGATIFQGAIVVERQIAAMDASVSTRHFGDLTFHKGSGQGLADDCSCPPGTALITASYRGHIAAKNEQENVDLDI
jgi:hypothetical protein